MTRHTILDKSQLVNYFASDCKRKELKLGLEFERICVDRSTWLPCSSQQVISALTALTATGWKVHQSYGLDYKLTKNGVSLTCEPGGQVEISLPPLVTATEIAKQLKKIDIELAPILARHNWELLLIGAHPIAERRGREVIPRLRHQIMNEEMNKHGSSANYAMCGTASIQISVDFSSEEDFLTKFRVGLAGMTVLLPLLASSPVINNRSASAASSRFFLWLYNDPVRCSLMPEVLLKGAGFTSYVDYLLSVPMLFVYQPETVLRAEGSSFVDFLEQRLAFVDRAATLDDWDVHLGTVFPPIRLLPGRLELRSADSMHPALVCGLCAFWRGLLTKQTILHQAAAAISDWQAYDFQFNLVVAAQGQPCQNSALLGLTGHLLQLAKAGLQGLDDSQEDLDYLRLIEERFQNCTPVAADLLALYQQVGEDEKLYLANLSEQKDKIYRVAKY